jgi:hypothetical protein
MRPFVAQPDLVGGSLRAAGGARFSLMQQQGARVLQLAEASIRAGRSAGTSGGRFSRKNV